MGIVKGAIHIEVSAINAVLKNEILPMAIHATAGAEQFKFWDVDVQPSMTATLLTGSVRCNRGVDGKWFTYNIAIDPDTFTTPQAALSLLDAVVCNAVAAIVNEYVAHIDGILCDNSFCADCYS